MKNFSIVRVLCLVLAIVTGFVVIYRLWDIHRPGFIPANLPCHNTPMIKAFDHKGYRYVFCKVRDTAWVEVWLQKSERWVRLKEQVIKLEPTTSIPSKSLGVI